MNPKIFLALSISVLWASSTFGDDNTWVSRGSGESSIALFHRLRGSDVRVASAQSVVEQSSSDHFPTQYMDPEDLDDLRGELVEQPVVSADAAASGQISHDRSSSHSTHTGEAPICGCGESAIQQRWSEDDCATGCSSTTRAVCAPARRHGCHQRRSCGNRCSQERQRCGRQRGHRCSDCDCGESDDCDSGCNFDGHQRMLGGSGHCHHGCGNCGAQRRGCHSRRHRVCENECEFVGHRCCGHGGMHLLGHIRCCR